MRALCRAFDWSSTPLGPSTSWPQSLRTTTAILLASRNPMFLWWGPELIQLYNDAYRPSFGAHGRHPRALGMRGRECWTDIWSVIGPQIEQVMTGGESTWHEDQYIPIERNGRLEDVWWTYSYSPVRDEEGRIAGTLVVCQETTDRVLAQRERERLLEDRRQAEEALRESESRLQRLYDVEQHARTVVEEAYRLAEAANRAKSQFLAVMSHELRTPLNAIGGYAELLEMGIRGPVTAEQREDLKRIQASQRHLLGLINEVLNYAKLETGTVSYDIDDVRVREALIAAESLVAPQARAKGLALVTTDCLPDVVARADAEKLRQVLVNLLSNAVKFTDSGGRVEMSCSADATSVHVHVRDTGIGIPADKLHVVFDPFVQVRSDLARRHEGTGLGLAISRDLARGMGGDLTVRSTLREGSTFTLVLPRASPQ
jgi:signal transduction histidine kinase